MYARVTKDHGWKVDYTIWKKRLGELYTFKGYDACGKLVFEGECDYNCWHELFDKLDVPLLEFYLKQTGRYIDEYTK